MFNLRTDLIDPVNQRVKLGDPLRAQAFAVVPDTFTIRSVAGTALTGTLSTKTFTRTTNYFFIERQVLTIGDRTAAGGYTEFAVSEAVSCGSADGVVESVEGNTISVITITNAAFGASGTLLGATTGVTATISAQSTQLYDWVGKWAWTHISGTTSAGKLCSIASMTNTTVVFNETPYGSMTAMIPFDTLDDAVAAMDVYIASSSAAQTPNVQANFQLLATSGTITINEGINCVLVDTTGGAVEVRLPDIATCENNQQFIIQVLNITAATTVKAFSAVQTLNGVNIYATPLATLDAVADAILIQRLGDVWVSPKSWIA